MASSSCEISVWRIPGRKHQDEGPSSSLAAELKPRPLPEKIGVKMDALSNSQIDEAIMSVTVTSWRKVAFVIAMADKLLGNNVSESEAGLHLVADRIECLIHDSRLLAQGDIKKWRYSEVRKPDSN
jgi:hypothetical protein